MALETATIINQRSNQKNEELEEEIKRLEEEYKQGLVPTPENVVVDEDDEEQPIREAPVETNKEEVELDEEEKTFKKRYGDLRTHSQKQKREIDNLRKELEELKLKQEKTPTEQKDNMPPSDPNKIKEWARQNPEAAGIIRALAGEESKELNTRLQNIEKVSQEIELEKHKAAVIKAHPDFEDIVAEDEFHDWAESQPDNIQNMIYNGVSKDVIWALSLYKREIKKQERQADKEAARGVQNRGKPSISENSGKGRFTESMVDRMTAEEYQKNEEAIQEAIRNGTFVYDMTGAAR